MVRADLAVFALGAVLFGAGLYGISTLPETSVGGAAGAFSVVWQESSKDLDLGSASLQDGGRTEATFSVAEGNLTRLVLVFACTDRHPLSQPQTRANLDITVAGPNNLTGTGQGSCAGDIEVEIPIQAAPTERTAAGASEEEARNALLAARTNTTSIGEWTARLSLSRATGLPVGQLGGADVTITGMAVRHEPTLTPQPR